MLKKHILVSMLLLPVILLTALAEEQARNDRQNFEVDAWAFDRGNMAVGLDQYRNGGPPPLFNGGLAPAWVEYDIPFPVAGRYKMQSLVAMHSVRPMNVFLDGKQIGTICRGKTTPSWNSIDAAWQETVELAISSEGIHTIKLVAVDIPPHFVKFRFETDQKFPENWALQRPKAEKLPVIEEQFQGETNLTATLPNPEAIRRAIVDLTETYGERYPHGSEYLKRLDAILAQEKPNQEQLAALRYEAVFLANPAVDFENLLLVRRHNKGSVTGLPTNWESNSSLPKSGYDDEIMTLALKSEQKTLASLYKPDRDTLVSDLDLDFDAARLMFSAVGENNRWHIFERDMQTGVVSQISSGDGDVDFYDSCYLPDGRIITTCTASMVGVPCVAGASHVANLFLLDPKTGDKRQLCFDQEHNWCPTVLNNGRVLYTRWEYADTPHANTRLLFHCNPDGTTQLEYYGSNSYWPTSLFYARPIPGHTTQIVGVVGGHHDSRRMGELVVLDPSISRHEADGAVQKIPGFGKKVEAVVADGLTRKAWPKFLHPYPLSDKYFLVAAKPTPDSLFGIYFIDLFDNMILIKELPDNALLEPVPLRSTERPPLIPDRIDLARNDADIYIFDIYNGPGLKGIPRGTVKSLKVFTYHFAYHGTGGLLGSVGQDGPWDVRGVLGTVPVEEDGSAHFQVPANLPIGVLPLDENGQSLQLMRSWMTAMPGENLHCVGCHELQNTAPPTQGYIPTAMSRKASPIVPYNPPNLSGETLLEQLNVRGFSFHEQVQPVLDRYCISCHNGGAESEALTALIKDRPVGTTQDGKPFALDLRGDRMIEGWASDISGNCSYMGWGGKWTVAYDNLQRFVRRPGIESDYALLSPMEFAANTTELVQILKQGHYGVELDEDSWNRLVTWIDMNTPFHGNWADACNGSNLTHIAQRRVELTELYGGIGIEFEKAKAEPQTIPVSAVIEKTIPVKEKMPLRFDAMTPEQAQSLQQNQADKETEKIIDLGNGLVIRLRWVPSYGELEKPFWMGECEITNAQFRQFDPEHDSGHETRQGYQFGRRGYSVNGDDLPAVRLNWNQADAFCRWLSEKTSLQVSLPTEQQWEYAARAGSQTPFWFGDLETDFSQFANMGDRRLKEFVACTAFANYTSVRIIPNPNPFDDRLPKDERFDDGGFLHLEPGSYLPNPFGLYDMHGNVAEWTWSDFQPQNGKTSEKIVKGGSWFDRPYRCASDHRLSYPPYQPVYNVGFRIVVNMDYCAGEKK